MILLSVGIDWFALLQVAIVTVVVTVVISGLMSLSNWFLTPAESSEFITAPRRFGGIAMICLVGLIVLFGLYLLIPYFH